MPGGTYLAALASTATNRRRLAIRTLVCGLLIGALHGLATGAPHAIPLPDAVPMAGLLSNNLRVAAVLVLGGALFGLPTLVALLWNGAVFGLVIARTLRHAGSLLPLAASIVPHGILEIPAILCCAGAGLGLGSQAGFAVGTLAKPISWRVIGRESLIGGGMFLLAAMLEVVVSPALTAAALHAPSPVPADGTADILRWVLTVALAVGVIWIIRAVALRRAARRPDQTELIFFVMVFSVPFVSVAAAAAALGLHADWVRQVRESAGGAMTGGVLAVLGLVLLVGGSIMVATFRLAFQIRAGLGGARRAAGMSPGRALVWLALIWLCLACGWAVGIALGLRGVPLALVIALLAYFIAWAGIAVFVAVRTQKLDPVRHAALFEAMQRFEIPNARLLLYDRPGLDVANAMALGPSWRFGRIVLTQPLLDVLDQEQLIAVLAHEAGHLRLGHIARLTVLSLVTTLAASALMVLGMPLVSDRWGAAGETLAFIVIGLVVPTLLIPIVLAASYRRCERAADRFAATLGQGPALARALDAMARHNGLVRERQPVTGWFALHPPVAERLRELRAES